MNGMTLEYKSYSPYYEKEESGVKPNTVRVDKGGGDLQRAETLLRNGEPVEITIRHAHPSNPLGSFTRRVTDVCWVGQICGLEVWVISWAHEERETEEEVEAA